MKLNRPAQVVLGALALAAWVGCMGAGFVMLNHHQAKAGEVGKVKEEYSIDALGPRGPGITVVMVAHPHCPCTVVSLSQLSLALTRATETVSPVIAVVSPTYAEKGWAEGVILNTARSMSHVRAVLIDEKQTGQLGPRTSGHVLAFGRDGKLLFSGGITQGRGHAGDNAGLDALVAVLRGETPEHRRMPVYGCPLMDSEACGKTVCPAEMTGQEDRPTGEHHQPRGPEQAAR